MACHQARSVSSGTGEPGSKDGAFDKAHRAGVRIAFGTDAGSFQIINHFVADPRDPKTVSLDLYGFSVAHPSAEVKAEDPEGFARFVARAMAASSDSDNCLAAKRD